MRRLLTALVLGSVAVLLAMGPASAAPPREDVLGDAISPKGDIVTGNYTVGFTDDVVSNVKLKVTTLQSVCGATAVYVAAQNLYKANVPGTCFTELSATQLRARFEMTWDPPPAGGTSTDKSPNSGWGPFLHAA